MAMTVRMVASGLVAVALFTQTGPSPDLDTFIRGVRAAIDKDDLTAASDLAAKLDDAVRRRFHAWLIRDANQRIDEVLTWLPEDIETLMVYQEPFLIDAKDSLSDLNGSPARRYTTDRLMALDGGKLYAALAGVTVRLVAAGMRTIRDRSSGAQETMTPALMPDGEAAYFYFLTDPLDPNILGRPEQTIRDHPVWIGTATVDAGVPIGPRVRPTREDTTWLALANPSLLVISNSRELLGLILQRIARRSRTRALPATLPEWAEVDRNADFWGLRHFSDPTAGRLDWSNPRSTINPRQGDPTAAGVTVRFYAGSRDLEIRYLSSAARLPGFIDGPPTPEFEADHIRGGLWRVTSNIHRRGDYPFHVAARLLGFGEYR